MRQWTKFGKGYCEYQKIICHYTTIWTECMLADSPCTAITKSAGIKRIAINVGRPAVNGGTCNPTCTMHQNYKGNAMHGLVSKGACRTIHKRCGTCLVLRGSFSSAPTPTSPFKCMWTQKCFNEATTGTIWMKSVAFDREGCIPVTPGSNILIKGLDFHIKICGNC